MPPLTISDALSQVETITLKVLDAPAKRDRWMVLLKDIRETVTHDPQFQLLIDNIMRLIEGEPAETLKPQRRKPLMLYRLVVEGPKLAQNIPEHGVAGRACERVAGQL